MKKIITLVMSLALLTGGLYTYDVKAATTENTGTVNKIESIMASNPMSASDVHTWSAGASHVNDVYKIKFAINSPAFVKVSINSTVCYDALELGTLKNAVVTTVSGKQVGESIGSSLGTIFSDETYEGYYLLEKGSYYVVYDGRDDDSWKSGGKTTTTIEAEYVSRTGNVLGVSTNMIPLTNNKSSYGLLSDLYSEQYFAVNLAKKSIVSFNMSLADTPSCFAPEVTYDLFSVKGVSYTSQLKKQPCLNHAGNDENKLGTTGAINWEYPSSGTTGSVTLPAGKYYLKISKNDSFGHNAGKIKITPHIKGVAKAKKLKAPKLKKYKRGSKKVSGTAPKKSTVTVKIGKRKYTKKATAKGKFSIRLKTKLKKKTRIKIYATKKGYKKSRTVTYKVK